MTIFQAIILAIIEGLTEFLPVSSTGHMIIGSSLMGITRLEFTKVFTVAIQFGTILNRPSFDAYAVRLRDRPGYQRQRELDNALIAKMQRNSQ